MKKNLTWPLIIICFFLGSFKLFAQEEKYKIKYADIFVKDSRMGGSYIGCDDSLYYFYFDEITLSKTTNYIVCVDKQSLKFRKKAIIPSTINTYQSLFCGMTLFNDKMISFWIQKTSQGYKYYMMRIDKSTLKPIQTPTEIANVGFIDFKTFYDMEVPLVGLQEKGFYDRVLFSISPDHSKLAVCTNAVAATGAITTTAPPPFEVLIFDSSMNKIGSGEIPYKMPKEKQAVYDIAVNNEGIASVAFYGITISTSSVVASTVSGFTPGDKNKWFALYRINGNTFDHKDIALSDLPDNAKVFLPSLYQADMNLYMAGTYFDKTTNVEGFYIIKTDSHSGDITRTILQPFSSDQLPNKGSHFNVTDVVFKEQGGFVLCFQDHDIGTDDYYDAMLMNFDYMLNSKWTMRLQRNCVASEGYASYTTIAKVDSVIIIYYDLTENLNAPNSDSYKKWYYSGFMSGDIVLATAVITGDGSYKTYAINSPTTKPKYPFAISEMHIDDEQNLIAADSYTNTDGHWNIGKIMIK